MCGTRLGIKANRSILYILSLYHPLSGKVASINYAVCFGSLYNLLNPAILNMQVYLKIQAAAS